MPLPHMRNPKSKEKFQIGHMIIAYHRPMNIGNLLSHRNLNTNPTALPRDGGPLCVLSVLSVLSA